MPSIVQSYQWFFRVTLPHTVFYTMKYDNLIRGWVDFKSCLSILHKGDKNENEHAHFCLTLTSSLQKQTVDKRIKSLFNVSGSNYSSKPWDGSDSALSYMFHEEPEGLEDIYMFDGYSFEDIGRYKELNSKVQAVVAINKERTASRHVDKVLDLIHASGSPWSKKQILDCFIRRVKTGEMYYPGDYQMKKYIEEILIRQTVSYEEITAYVEQKYYELYLA